MPIPVDYRPALTTVKDTRIELDGWSAGAPHTIDAQGTIWELQSVEGWQTAPSVRSDRTARPGEHGSFDGPTWLAERLITLTGTAAAVDFASAQRARDILVSVAGDPSLGLLPLLVYEEGRPTKRATVRRSAEARTSWISDMFFAWQLLLVAPDPRRYSSGENSTFTALPGTGVGGLVFPLVFPLTFGSGAAGGEMTLTNAGTVATWPTWEIRGPVTAPVITNPGTGTKLEFDAAFAIAAGVTVTVDTDAKTVLEAGTVNRRDKLITAQWWRLDPGSTQVRFSGASVDPANARLTARWRDAWT